MAACNVRVYPSHDQEICLTSLAADCSISEKTLPASHPAGRENSSMMRRAFVADQKPLQHQGLIRLGVITYICALLLIAAFSIAFHFITDNIVHRQQATAAIVNVSGRQRMLSQRIAELALERASHASFRPDAQTQQQMNAAITLMANSHEALVHGSVRLGIAAPPSDAGRQVYFAGPYDLDTKMENFLKHARALASAPEASLTLLNPDLRVVEQAAQEPLLTALNAAVEAYQDTSERAIKHLREVLAALTLLMLLILVLEALFLYRPLFRRLESAHDELVMLGRTDPLTGCLNRRAFTQEAYRIVEECRSRGEGLATLMIDIDRFKSVNDRFGHPAGDRVINNVVSTLLNHTREGNLICRMGGEEFAILLRGSSVESATAAANGLREKVAAAPVMLDQMPAIPITVSVGVATLNTADKSIFHMLGRADKALYRAKMNGRNRVEAEVLDEGGTVSVPYPANVRTV